MSISKVHNTHSQLRRQLSMKTQLSNDIPEPFPRDSAQGLYLSPPFCISLSVFWQRSHRMCKRFKKKQLRELFKLSNFYPFSQHCVCREKRPLFYFNSRNLGSTRRTHAFHKNTDGEPLSWDVFDFQRSVLEYIRKWSLEVVFSSYRIEVLFFFTWLWPHHLFWSYCLYILWDILHPCWKEVKTM